MDIKTILKVVNSMAEKIELLEDKLRQVTEDEKRKRLDLYNNYLENLTKITKLEKINLLNADRNNKNMEHFESLGDRVNNLEDRQIKFDIRIYNLEDKYKYMFNNKDVKCLIERCDDLEAKNYIIKGDLDKLINNNKGETNE